jgi:hypothetical protein
MYDSLADALLEYTISPSKERHEAILGIYLGILTKEYFNDRNVDKEMDSFEILVKKQKPFLNK